MGITKLFPYFSIKDVIVLAGFLKNVFNMNYGFKKMHVRIYEIKDHKRKTLKSITVFDNDFSDLWYIFKCNYGKIKNKKQFEDGTFSCTAQGKTYFIE